jgi:hypothetical protein
MSEMVLKNPVLQATAVISRSCVLHSTPRGEGSQQTPELDSQDGVYVEDLPQGAVLELETKYHCYTLVKAASGQVLISGHPVICPEPVLVEIEGSVTHGLKLKIGFIGRGLRLKFHHPAYHTLTTSRILDLRQIG